LGAYLKTADQNMLGDVPKPMS